MANLHRTLRGYAPTPLHSLPGEADGLGVGAVWLKDESNRFGLPAFKILGASWAVEQVLRLRPDTAVVVAASAGNHGRAVARAAAQRGLGCRIHLPAGASSTRAHLIEQEGAEVVFADGGYEDAVAAAEAEARATGATLVADTALRPGSVTPGWVVDGYSTLFREAAAQRGARFDAVLVPAGVGSLAAAAVRWAVHEQQGAAVVAVEPASAACITASLLAGERTAFRPTVGAEGAVQSTTMAGLDCAVPSADAWPTLSNGLAGGLAVSDEEAHLAMRDLATAGLVIGDCGAATLAALRALLLDQACTELRTALGLGPGSAVLCIGSEGASDPDAYRAVVGAEPEQVGLRRR